MTEEERQSRVAHFNAGAAGSPEEPSYEAGRRAEPRSLFGRKDIEALFPEGSAPARIPPFPHMGRSKGPKYDQAAVTEELNRPEARTVDLDPRLLSSSQSSVHRAGVEHYLTGEAEMRGETFERSHNIGNQFPFVVTQRSGTGHQHVIISGHHRATGALLRGEKLRTRWIEET
jgi:hypothetical protein